MANNRLQLRRDSAADFADASNSTVSGEPILDTDTGRIRVDNLGGGGHLHQVQPGVVPTEGSPFHLLWNVQGYNNRAHLTVPPTPRGVATNSGTKGASYSAATAIPPDSPLTEASIPAVSASVPDLALQDAATAYIRAVGDYETGSSSPAMMFAFQLGNDEDLANQTRISPKTEGEWMDQALKADGTPQVPAAATPVGVANTRLPGIVISNDTHGPNVLQYDGKFQWELDAKVDFLGHNGGGAFPSAGTGTSTVRVTAKVRWGKLSQFHSGQYMGKTIAGYKNAYTVGGTMTDDGTGGTGGTYYPYGWIHGTGTAAYQAVGPIAVSNNASLFNATTGTIADISSRYNNLVAQLNTWFSTAPGIGSNWQNYWRLLVNEETFTFEEEVELKQDGVTLSLMVGGPMQDDLTVVPNRISVTASGAIGGGGAQALNGLTGYFRQATMVRPATDTDGEAVYAARVPHTYTTSVTPKDDPDDYTEWRRLWYRLADDRADRMRVYSSTAYLVGGRNGVSDFNPH